MELREPEQIIHFDSVRHGHSDGYKSHIYVDLSNAPLKLSKGKQHWLSIESLAIPLTNYNITAALGNNTFRYCTDQTDEKTGTWKVCTLSDGVYSSLSVINTAMQYCALQNGDYLVPDVSVNPLANGQIQYPFAIWADPAASKGVLGINTVYWETVGTEEYKSVSVDLTNNGTSSLYLLGGFTVAEALLQGYLGTYVHTSTSNIALGNDGFYLSSNLCMTNLGSGKTNIFFSDTFYGTANTLFLLPNDHRQKVISPIMPDVYEINKFELKILGPDASNLILLSDNSAASTVRGQVNFY